MSHPEAHPPLSLWRLTLLPVCPRCGKALRNTWGGWGPWRKSCPVCSLDFKPLRRFSWGWFILTISPVGICSYLLTWPLVVYWPDRGGWGALVMALSSAAVAYLSYNIVIALRYRRQCREAAP